VQVSALTGEGMPELHRAVARFSRSLLTALDVVVPYTKGSLVSTIFDVGRDVLQEAGPDGTRIRALVPPAHAARIHAALRDED